MRSTALALVVSVASWGVGHSQAQAPAAATPPFEAGKHYTMLSPAQPTSTDAGKVEVAEIFMFGCPGCNSFEPHIQSWLGRKADYINFVRIPAAWNPPAPLHARAFYTAEALGKADEIAGDFFNEIHVNRNLLETEAKLVAFFAKHGVDEATFKSMFNSFAVDTKVKQAQELIGRYRVESTPTVIVNGKYATSGRHVGQLRGMVRDHRRSRGARARRGERSTGGAVAVQDSGNPRNHTPKAFHAGTRCNVSVPT